MNPKLSVVIPVLNEADSLPELYQRLSEVMRALTADYELIVVDDGSTDNTFAVLASLQPQDDHLTVIQLRRTYGKAAALAMGFKEAKGEQIITLDADLQDQPEEIPRLLEGLASGADLVSGRRRRRQDGLGKVLASRVFNAVTRWLSGVRLHDINCGLKAYRREVLDALHLRGELHRYTPVMAHWQGFQVGEVAVKHQPRRHGVSKYGRERFLRGFFDLLTVMLLTRYLGRPLHLFGSLGLALILVGLGINMYLVAGWLLNQWWLGDRPLLLLGVLMMIIGVQFALFGLLAEMVAGRRGDDTGVLIRRRLP